MRILWRDLAIATMEINDFEKGAPDCRRVYYDAIPRARAFSEFARGPSVSVATPRILVTGQVAALRGPARRALTRFRTTTWLPRIARGLAHRGAKMCTAPKRELRLN